MEIAIMLALGVISILLIHVVGKFRSQSIDTDRLNWLIRQGPPRANDGIGLNQEAWDRRFDTVIYSSREAETDEQSIRASIDAAMDSEQDRLYGDE